MSSSAEHNGVGWAQVAEDSFFIFIFFETGQEELALY
jgi:hypothetical protein